jgi:hypothetical protein
MADSRVGSTVSSVWTVTISSDERISTAVSAVRSLRVLAGGRGVRLARSRSIRSVVRSTTRTERALSEGGSGVGDGVGVGVGVGSGEGATVVVDGGLTGAA